MRPRLTFGAGALPAGAASVRQSGLNVGSPLLVYGSTLPAPTPPSAHSNGTPLAQADGARSATNVDPQLDAEQAPAGRDVSRGLARQLVSVHGEPRVMVNLVTWLVTVVSLSALVFTTWVSLAGRSLPGRCSS